MQKTEKKRKYGLKVMVIFFLTGLMFTSGYGLAQNKAAVIDKYISACFDRELVNGAVLVAVKGNIIYKKAFGLANSDWDIPNGTDTKFYLYTLTQQFTAALILKLVEEGKIKLDGTIIDYLPDYREDTSKKVTIHHLLTHTHGLQDLEYSDLPLVNVFTVPQFVQRFLSRDPEFEPGKQFKFNTFTGYTLLAVIIEKVTGKTYEQVLNEKILKPLKMENSGFINHDAPLKKRASAYRGSTDERRTEFFKFRCNGATSMYATVADLLAWDRALAGNTLFSKKTKELMFTAHVAGSQGGSTGYGWNVVNLTSDKIKKRVVWQTGSGFTAIWRILDDDIAIIFLNNTISAKLIEMCIGISNILYNRPGVLPKRSFVNSLNKIVATKGVQAAIQRYNELRKNQPDEYNFEESELSLLGNYLLSINKIAEAIEIFKLNLSYYPQSWYIYARLGEALVRGNNVEVAIQFFETAIKLMPRGEEKAYRDIMALLKQLKEQKEVINKNESNIIEK